VVDRDQPTPHRHALTTQPATAQPRTEMETPGRPAAYWRPHQHSRRPQPESATRNHPLGGSGLRGGDRAGIDRDPHTRGLSLHPRREPGSVRQRGAGFHRLLSQQLSTGAEDPLRNAGRPRPRHARRPAHHDALRPGPAGMRPTLSPPTSRAPPGSPEWLPGTFRLAGYRPGGSPAVTTYLPLANRRSGAGPCRSTWLTAPRRSG
jgi:hypothetical protein